jgi:hypothetical protein
VRSADQTVVSLVANWGRQREFRLVDSSVERKEHQSVASMVVKLADSLVMQWAKRRVVH